MQPDMPERERPISERYRIAGKTWAACRRTFRGYDKRKDILFDEMVLEAMRQMQKELEERASGRWEKVSKTQAEMKVRTSNTWKNYIDKMLEAEHQMNLAEVEKDAIDMEHWEQNDANATARDERRSYRMGG